MDCWMDTLYLLQFACCIVTAMLAAMLIYSRFQMRWINRRYELSRWLICVAMILLAIHYVLQMGHGLRASGDDVGAVVNILFYSPCVVLVSLGIINVECGRIFQRRYFMVSVVGFALILVTFLVGLHISGSLHLGAILYVMLAQFFFMMSYFTYSSLHEAHMRRKVIEDQTATDLLPYDRYTSSSLMFLSAMSLALVFVILNRSFLYVFGPLMLVSLFYFIMAFIGLGYNFRPFDGILEDDAQDAEADLLQESHAGKSSGCDVSLQTIDKSRMEEIDKIMKEWCASDGFRDSEINMSILSRRLGIPRRELTAYFERYLKSSFRVWLSELRFQEACRMLTENPNYSNEAISVGCGFSSHAHLYRIFRIKTGMTPRKYREKLIEDAKAK